MYKDKLDEQSTYKIQPSFIDREPNQTHSAPWFPWRASSCKQTIVNMSVSHGRMQRTCSRHKAWNIWTLLQEEHCHWKSPDLKMWSEWKTGHNLKSVWLRLSAVIHVSKLIRLMSENNTFYISVKGKNYLFTFVVLKRFCCLHTCGQHVSGWVCHWFVPNTTLVLLTVRKFALHFGDKVWERLSSH